MGTKDNIINARKRIENAMEVAEKERRRKLLTYRLEIAHAGIVAYQKKNISEAIKNYQIYLKILEELKTVSPGGLHPTQFTEAVEKNELLMISGVYWDLVKLFDKAKSVAKKKEFRHYIEKYVLFSKGMPFQHTAAESLRKHIASGKAQHTGDFKSAYRLLGGAKCFIATSLIDLCAPETLPRLQHFRDESLQSSPLGRIAIRCYYACGPMLATILDHMPGYIRTYCARLLDRWGLALSKD